MERGVAARFYLIRLQLNLGVRLPTAITFGMRLNQKLLDRALAAGALLFVVAILPGLANAVHLAFELEGGAYGVSSSYVAPKGLSVVLLDSAGHHWSTQLRPDGKFRLAGWGRPRPPLAIALCDPAHPSAVVPMLSLAYSGSIWLLDKMPPRGPEPSGGPNAPCLAPVT